MINQREIVRELRLKLREYFPLLQSFIDQNIITKNDWKFYGTIQFNLIKCFTTTPEKAIRDSKTQLNKIVKFYEKETRIRKLGLKSDLFISEQKIEREKLKERFKYYHSHLEYWRKRKESSDIYLSYEIHMFLYYKWMNNYEFDEENTLNLLLDLMGLCSYYAFRYFDIERLASEKHILMSNMKVSSTILGIIDQNLDTVNVDKESQSLGEALMREAKAHLD